MSATGGWLSKANKYPTVSSWFPNTSEARNEIDGKIANVDNVRVSKELCRSGLWTQRPGEPGVPHNSHLHVQQPQPPNCLKPRQGLRYLPESQ